MKRIAKLDKPKSNIGNKRGLKLVANNRSTVRTAFIAKSKTKARQDLEHETRTGATYILQGIV